MAASHIEVIVRQGADDAQRPPLLFVHGAGHGAWAWDEHFLGFFAAHGFDAYALSLRGHGESAGREQLSKASIADYASDVHDVAAGLPDVPVVVGHSLGARVVMKYLETHAAPAAALLAPLPRFGLLLSAARAARDHPGLAIRALLAGKPGRLLGARRLARQLNFSPELDEELVIEYASRQGPESTRAMAQLTYVRPDRARIRARGVPLLVIGASGDYFVRPAAIRRVAASYGAEVKIVPGVAHCMILDARWRDVAGALLEWLEQVPALSRDGDGHSA
ncbi:MAG: lysophospholipase [Chloroflexi bacterium]|nr:lysophospholipase [Chloroflexota bacterium]